MVLLDTSIASNDFDVVLKVAWFDEGINTREIFGDLHNVYKQSRFAVTKILITV